MKCPSCGKGETFRPWSGKLAVMGVEVAATGKRCSSCDETLFTADEVEQQERAAAELIVARGVRTGEEFRFVRKVAGLRANDVAAMLDATPETVSRWEGGKLAIPRLAAFALGELFEHPKIARRKLEAFA